MKLRHASTSLRLRRGFTLVEIMVAVAILGILIAVAVPAYQRYQRKAEETQLVNNLRIFSQAFNTFAMKYGTFPGSQPVGTLPAGLVDNNGDSMQGELRDADWTSTWKGGQYKWDGWVVGTSSSSKPSFTGSGSTIGTVTGAISIVGTTTDTTEMTEIDAIIDDGNLSTGSFQQTGSNQYTYVVQK